MWTLRFCCKLFVIELDTASSPSGDGNVLDESERVRLAVPCIEILSSAQVEGSAELLDRAQKVLHMEMPDLRILSLSGLGHFHRWEVL